MSQYEYDLYINKVKVATFYDEDTLREVLWKIGYYNGEIKIVPYIINDLGESVEVK